MKKIKSFLYLIYLILCITAISCGTGKNKNKNSNAYGNKTNSAPIADAGPDKTVIVNTLVILDGSKSSDPEGASLTYKWSLSVPDQSQAVLSDSTSVKPKFTPEAAGTYIAKLIVNDGNSGSAPDTVIITAKIKSSANSAPIASAGDNITVAVNTIATLDGSKSSDPDGDSLTYKWSLSVPDQSQTVLTESTLVKTEFTPDINGIYIATLIVNDGLINSNPDSITINAAAISFSKDVQTIFNNNCIGCHSQGSLASFFRLTSEVSYSNLVNVQAEKSSGIRVIPFNSSNSILILRISGNSVGAQMPKGGSPLNSQNQNLIKKWIDEGAKNN
ncbi:hypothetical protein HY745_01760 [Candidatus Desantisbacteria bacterium]|nr:hypothetical protein [Candidatus Desantisbacteria bacterium]